MGIRRGEITTKIVSDGLVFNMDAANRASYVPNADTSFNTINLSNSGSFSDSGMYSSENEGTFIFDGIDDQIQCNQINLATRPNKKATCIIWIKDTGADRTGTYFGIGDSAGEWQSNYFSIRVQNDILYGNIKHTSTAWSSWDSVTMDSSFTSADGWANFCFTVNCDTAELIGYKNGVAVATTSISSGNQNGIGADYLWLPTLQPLGGTGGAIQCHIGSVQIYNRALSAEEVLRNYNGLRGRFGV